jgi:hypothetical protein
MAEKLTPGTSDESLEPGVGAAIDGVAASHAGHPLDEVLSVLREAIGIVDPTAPDRIPSHRLRDIAEQISNDHHRR